MKITKLIDDGFKIENSTILSLWDYEEADSILLEYINHSELDYDRDKQVLNIDRNQLLLSESTPFKYDFREENSDTYFYN